MHACIDTVLYCKKNYEACIRNDSEHSLKTAPLRLQSLESHFLRIEDWVPPEAKILTQLSKQS